MLLHTSNFIQTSLGSISVEKILRNNNIVYPSIEFLNETKYFYIKNIDILYPDKYISTNRIKYIGKIKSIKVFFKNGENYILPYNTKILETYYDKNEWKRLDKVRNTNKLLSIIGREVSTTNIINYKYVGFTPMWSFIINEPFILLKNGIVVKNNEYDEYQ